MKIWFFVVCSHVRGYTFSCIKISVIYLCFGEELVVRSFFFFFCVVSSTMWAYNLDNLASYCAKCFLTFRIDGISGFFTCGCYLLMGTILSILVSWGLDKVSFRLLGFGMCFSILVILSLVVIVEYWVNFLDLFVVNGNSGKRNHSSLVGSFRFGL